MADSEKAVNFENHPINGNIHLEKKNPERLTLDGYSRNCINQLVTELY